MPRPQKSVRPRFRIFWGEEIAIGPGKAELLQAILDTGSIQQAAASLNMSYMRAWKLVHTMNECFKEPLVGAHRGGKQKGGAWLTPFGSRILKLYLSLERKSLANTKLIWRELLKALR